MARYTPNHMKKTLALLFSCLFITAVSAQLDSPVGRWTTIDEESGKVNSIIEIYPNGDTYSGKISEILTGNTTAVCTECDDFRKGKPILGMVILEDLSRNEDEPAYWTGGTILDPKKGSTYKLSVWFEDGDANVLYVRGKHWTGLYRTQEWIRQ